MEKIVYTLGQARSQDFAREEALILNAKICRRLRFGANLPAAERLL